MGGAMRKMGVYLGLLEDSERYDEDLYEEGADDYTRAVPGPPAQVAQLDDRRRQAPASVPAPRVADLSRITTLHPSTYNEARTIGENFRAGIPVIMNLSEMDDATAKRLVDFSAGLVFAVHGSLEKVTSKVFLLSPPNVSVAAEDKARIAEGGFFNQS